MCLNAGRVCERNRRTLTESATRQNSGRSAYRKILVARVRLSVKRATVLARELKHHPPVLSAG